MPWLLMRGVRRSGERAFQLELVGAQDPRLPPRAVQMSLAELEEWLAALPEPPAQPLARPLLRAIS